MTSATLDVIASSSAESTSSSGKSNQNKSNKVGALLWIFSVKFE